jgi:hypothetical protein
MYNSEINDIISQDKTVEMGFQGILAADKLPGILQTGQSLILTQVITANPHALAMFIAESGRRTQNV